MTFGLGRLGASFGKLGAGTSISTPAFSLTAPVLAFASATDPDSDNTQDMDADITEALGSNVIRFVGTFGSATVSEPYDVDTTGTDGDLDLNVPITTGAIDVGVCSFKCRIETAGGSALSDWSNTITKTISAASVTYEDAGISVQATNGATSTFATNPIGTAATGRLLVIFVVGHAVAASPGLSGVTVNGNAATLVGSTYLGVDQAIGCFKYALDTGTTADIVASWNGVTVGRAECAVFALYGANHTETDTDGANSGAGSNLTNTSTIDVPTGGIAFGVEMHQNVNATVWTGTGTVADTATTAVEAQISMSSCHNITPGAGQSLIATWTGNNRNANCAAAWGL